MSDTQTIKIGFPLYDDCTLLDFAGATQVFTPFSGAGFEPIWLAMDDQKIETSEGAYLKPIKTTEGVYVTPNMTFSDAPMLDVLFVPGGGPGVAKMMQDDHFLAGIRRLAEPARWVGSICTGAFILAAARLLDGRKATTYWSQLENLRRFHNSPANIDVDLDCYPRALIGEGRFTGGGISSSIDLALRLVEELANEDGRDGAEVAKTVQLAIQYAPDPKYHSGDPKEAASGTVQNVQKNERPFTEAMRKATDTVIAKMK